MTLINEIGKHAVLRQVWQVFESNYMPILWVQSCTTDSNAHGEGVRAVRYSKSPKRAMVRQVPRIIVLISSSLSHVRLFGVFFGGEGVNLLGGELDNYRGIAFM